MIPIHPIPDPWLAGAHEVCNACSCYWRDEEPHPKEREDVLADIEDVPA